MTERPSRMAFIGTSGVGKTHLAREFAQTLGYAHVEADELIGNMPEMKLRLQFVAGRDHAEKMGRLFGAPWENASKYAGLQDEFLALERTAMKKLIEEIKNGGHTNTVFDLTGSMAYLSDTITELRAQDVVVVHLKANQQHMHELIAAFLEHPKPVVWGQLIAEWKGKSAQDLDSMYPRLLDIRTKAYQQNADVELAWEEHRDEKNAQTILEMIMRKRLAA